MKILKFAEDILTLPPVGVAEYCDQRFVCVFVCLRTYFQNYTSDHHQTFGTYFLSPWLGPPVGVVVRKYASKFIHIVA